VRVENGVPVMAPNEPSTATVMALLALVAVLFAAVPLGLAWLWARWVSPPKPGAIKNATYECGLEARGDAWIQFQPQYYLYAIIFLVFDVETLFLFPFAVAFTGLPAGAFAAMIVFLVLLVEGLVWAWQKGVLKWEAAGSVSPGSK
jgi:NADH:ubiquinone oxidoreductase subunit 3 (subunit A)